VSGACRWTLALAALVAWPLACSEDVAPPTEPPLGPEDVARIEKANRAMATGLPETVHDTLAELLDRRPIPAEAQWLAGQAAYSLQSYGEAVERLGDVTRRDADAYLPRSVALGFAQYKLGDFDDAEATFAAIAARAPDNPKAHYGLGQLDVTAGRDEDARVHLERALALAPDYLKARFAMARALDGLGRDDEALEAVETVVARWPSHEEALYLWARLLSAAGRTEEAERVLARRSTIYAAKEAIGQLGQRIRAGEDSPALRRAIIEAFAALGDERETRRAVVAALERFPDDASLRDTAERLLGGDR